MVKSIMRLEKMCDLSDFDNGMDARWPILSTSQNDLIFHFQQCVEFTQDGGGGGGGHPVKWQVCGWKILADESETGLAQQNRPD